MYTISFPVYYLSSTHVDRMGFTKIRYIKISVKSTHLTFYICNTITNIHEVSSSIYPRCSVFPLVGSVLGPTNENQLPSIPRRWT